MSALPSRRGPLIALCVAAVVLLGTAVTTGAILFGMLGRHTAPAAPGASPTPSATATAEAKTVHDIPITVAETALEFGDWVATPWVDGETTLYAPVGNASDSQAVSAFYDVTAYDQDGRVLDRAIGSADLLPGGEGILDVINLRADAAEVASILVEQTHISAEASPYSGSVGTAELTVDREFGEVEFVLPSTLDPVPDWPWADVAAFVGDEMVGVCDATIDLKGSAFAGRCYLRPTAQGVAAEPPEDFVSLPEDAEVRVFLRPELDLQ
ncbi:hypothetical protein ACFWHT_01275 [Microbacterium sp. NPDC058342]|uniref:hypothetical protein n=1 Tax=Microbacterium sp. NPDC058342 TaxID=3346454 RepID=UPI0036514840